MLGLVCNRVRKLMLYFLVMVFRELLLFFIIWNLFLLIRWLFVGGSGQVLVFVGSVSVMVVVNVKNVS